MDRKEQQEKTNLWDAFQSYIESVYFPGAADELESNLINFEFEKFKTEHPV
jgi:hypothetical protein